MDRLEVAKKLKPRHADGTEADEFDGSKVLSGFKLEAKVRWAIA